MDFRALNLGVSLALKAWCIFACIFSAHWLSADERAFIPGKKELQSSPNGIIVAISFGMASTDINHLLQNNHTYQFPQLGLRAGYQHFVNHYFGWRAYIDGHIGVAPDKEVVRSMRRVTQGLIALNADILFDYNLPHTTHYIGIFGGLGYGVMRFGFPYDVYTNTSSGMAVSTHHESLIFQTLFYNVGLALTFDARHRIELYAKIPAVKNYDEKFHYAASPLLSAAYQFTF